MGDETSSIPATAAATADGAGVPSMPTPALAKKAKAGGSTDMAAIGAIGALILALVIPLYFLLRTQKGEEKKKANKEAADQERLDAAARKKQAKLERGAGKKKKGGMARMRKGGGVDDDDDDEPAARAVRAAASSDDDDDDSDGEGGGTRQEQRRAQKKAEKRAAAADRNDQREAVREYEAEKDAARRTKEEAREAKEKAREERQRLAAEEAARKKQEELDKWASSFSVEEAGEEEGGAAEDEGRLGRFVTDIRTQKVAVLEELAHAFGLKTQEVIARVQSLEAMGHLTGVIDDRGKFIFISEAEMAAVAKFVNKKGRVRISTLAQESNRLIDLTPKKLAEEEEDEEEEGAEAS